MPHVIVKFHSGRGNAEKSAMADAVAAALHETMGYDVANVSVSIEEVDKSDWMATVYEPEIVGRQHQLVKRPGYGSLRVNRRAETTTPSIRRHPDRNDQAYPAPG